MSLDERDFVIALSLLPFLTPSRTRRLREHFEPLSTAGNASSVLLQGLLSVTPEQAAQVKNPLNVRTRTEVEAIRETVVAHCDNSFPKLLAEIVDPPLVLHTRGDRTLLDRPAVAVVGSRRATPYGINAARELAQRLVSAGVVIVSGLARGIDAAAHEAALEAGGKTVAVLGTGIDVIYPRSHGSLFRRIEKEGLLLSEFPPGTPPLKENFPVRNRIISGLCSGAVIVEATGRSGSLITARMAAEQGREVFAVPGSIFSPNSEGTHRLIQCGAKLVHDVEDILEELPGSFRAVQAAAEAPPPELASVLALLQREEGTHVDALAARLSRPAGFIAESLLRLELAGWVRALPGARYVRAK